MSLSLNVIVFRTSSVQSSSTGWSHCFRGLTTSRRSLREFWECQNPHPAATAKVNQWNITSFFKTSREIFITIQSQELQVSQSIVLHWFLFSLSDKTADGLTREELDDSYLRDSVSIASTDSFVSAAEVRGSLYCGENQNLTTTKR